MAKENWDEDREAVRLVLQNHKPVEFPKTGDPDPLADPVFLCSYCKNEWPCKSKTKADKGNEKFKAAGKEVRGNEPVTPSSVAERTSKGVVGERRDF